MLAFLVCVLAAAAIDIGSRLEMFVDRFLVDKTQNVQHKLTEPQRREVVLETNAPWENDVSAYFTVFRDGERIRMYYRAGGDENAYTCYAESTDGVRFTRPNLGIYEFNGSKDNNILFRGPQSASFAPFRDLNPDAKPDERYKALCYHVRNRTGTMSAMASPDGIHWRMMQDGSVVPAGEYDSLNCVSWDPAEKQYRVFDRYWTGHGFKGVRQIETRTSSDFLNWSEPTPFAYGDGVPLEHFYTGSVTRCPGAEQFWLAFPKRFVPDRKRVASHKEPGVSDAVFMSSRDGVRWDRCFLEAWLRPGPDERNWTERSNMTAWGVLEPPGDATTFSMYVSEHYRWPTNRLRRVTVRKHGFASMHAGAAGGEFATEPITFTGTRLMLNYATSAAGSVRVELLDEAGQKVDETPEFFGDEIEREVTWTGKGLAAVPGKPVRLRFVLRDADVYALRFTP
jgi:hypothetical protein